jgi:hypothetical protein
MEPPSHARNDALDGREADERGYEERDVTDDLELSDDERLEHFRESMSQSVLPDLPQEAGYHTCWLTTTNPRDSIQRRQMMGYELITPMQVPGWFGGNFKTGAVGDVVQVNEMVAARIPLRLHNRMMAYAHHELPLSEEEKLRSRIDEMRQSAESRGIAFAEGDGMANIVQKTTKPMPQFTS